MLRLSSRCPECLRHVGSATATPTTLVRAMSRDAVLKKLPSRLVLSTKAAVENLKRKPGDFTIPGLNQRIAKLRPNMSRRQRGAQEGMDSNKAKREMKHMKMQQALAGVSRVARSVAQERIQSLDSFDDFGLLPSVREAIVKDVLGDLETVAPTAVQKLVIPTLTGKGSRSGRTSTARKDRLESYLIAAETGSGKTLAYALPVIDFIKRQEAEELEAEKQERLLNPHMPTDSDLEIPTVPEDQLNGRPRAVILLPTSELVSQVGEVVKSLSHTVKFRTAVISREFSARVIKNRLFGGPVDIVICTPSLLNSLTETNPALFSRCTHVVVDEADSLFDRSFWPITSALITRCSNLKQLILCSATIPRSLDTRLRELYPEMKRLVTPNLHVVPRRVQLQVVDAENELYRGNKKLACADTLYTISKDGTEEGFMKKVIVFVNERETTAELVKYLRTKGIDAVGFERDSQERNHAEILEMFTGGKQDAEPGATGRQRMKVLVTTDITSRGVDTKTVKNVVLFDKPHSAVDLIHRIGRTGRMGRRGRAVILVDKHTNRGWIKDIKTSMHMGGPLI